MQSGDAAFNAEITRDVKRVVGERIQKQPQNWWLVKDVADLYIEFRNGAKRRRAESALLAPLGLTINNYRDEIGKFGDDNAQQLMRDLINFDVPHTAVIITGIDERGTHIYVVNDGEISCNDVVGFAAVGIGARHAESQFMLARHSWNSPLVDTALLAYIAKKRSEIAPGVGEATDMFSAGPGLGTLAPISEAGIQGFDEIYRKLREKEGLVSMKQESKQTTLLHNRQQGQRSRLREHNSLILKAKFPLLKASPASGLRERPATKKTKQPD